MPTDVDDEHLLRIGLEKDRTPISLLNGHRQAGVESADDQSLMNKLAYWLNCNDALMRDKFLNSPSYRLNVSPHRNIRSKRIFRWSTSRGWRRCMPLNPHRGFYTWFVDAFRRLTFLFPAAFFATWLSTTCLHQVLYCFCVYGLWIDIPLPSHGYLCFSNRWLNHKKPHCNLL